MLQIEVIPVRAHHLKERIETQADRRQPGYRSREYGMRPHFRLRGCAQHHRRNLDECLIILRELEAGILEGLAEIIELGEVDVASTAGSTILTGKSRYSVAARRPQEPAE